MLAAILGIPVSAIAYGFLALVAAIQELLAVVLMGIDGVMVTPQVVVAVAVAFELSIVLPTPGPKPLPVVRSH